MSSRKKIVFHIGTVKTGSTSIQYYLWKNQDSLRNMNVDYIQLCPAELHLPRYANGHYFLRDFFDKNSFVDIVMDSPCGNIIISEEGLWANLHAIPEEFYEIFDITFLIYIRNPTDLVGSWAAECCQPYNYILQKSPTSSGYGVIGFDDLVNLLCDDYAKIFHSFFDRIKKSNFPEIIFCNFELARHSCGVLNDFFGKINEIFDNSLGLFSDSEVFLNQVQDRKWCDVSYLTAIEMEKLGKFEMYNPEFVKSVYSELLSGDKRPVTQTLDLEILRHIREKTHFIYNEIKKIDHSFSEFRMLSKQRRKNAKYTSVCMKELECVINKLTMS